MSARPRPVTATFKPASMQPPTGMRERNYSLSSGGSTESLVSVLDHDSCESPDPSDHEDAGKKNGKVKQNKEEKKCEVVDDTYTESTTQTPTESTKQQADEEISAWEKWMIQKAKEMRIKQKKEVQRVEMEKKKQEEEQKEKQEKEKEINEKVNTWIEKKNLQLEHRKKMEERRSSRKQKEKEEEKKKIEEKSKEKYEEWMNTKKEKEKERKRQEKEKLKEEQQKKEERQKKCEEAFEEWSKRAQKRPRSVPSSFGYTTGKLTVSPADSFAETRAGYHDSGAYPVPGFYNPIPWQPIHVPRPKSETKKKKPKYKWNPNKYL